MVARLEAIKDISCIAEKLEALEYEIATISNKIIFIYRKGSNISGLKNDIKSAKSACKFSGSIKSEYGHIFTTSL